MQRYSATMRLLYVGVVSAVFASAAVEPPADLAKVRKLRAGLAKISGQSALPAALVTEAKAVVADADKALNVASPDETALKKVVGEYNSFVADLMHKRSALTNEKESIAVDEAQDAKAAALVPIFETKLHKVLDHIKADSHGLTDVEAASRTEMIKMLEEALAAPKEKQPAIERAMLLHKAMEAVHDFEAKRTQDLGVEEKKLAVEIDEANVKILFGMLKQRAKLPMKSQVSILKRHQFKNCTYAQQLLKEHKNKGGPLWKQLQEMLPANLAKLGDDKANAKSAGHLAAAGSDGRVSVVSSRLKNSVKMMMQQLTAARDKLVQMAEGNSETAAEKKQANEIIAGLNEQLQKASKTNDLKTQLEIMDAVQDKLAGWAKGARVASTVKSLLQVDQQPLSGAGASEKPTKETQQPAGAAPVKR